MDKRHPAEAVPGCSGPSRLPLIDLNIPIMGSKFWRPEDRRAAPRTGECAVIEARRKMPLDPADGSPESRGGVS
jgi:hypothetical protein